MEARIFSPFLRLWRKSDDECLLENDAIVLQHEEHSLEVDEKCFVDRNAHHKMEESSHTNTDEFATINLQEDTERPPYPVTGEVSVTTEVTSPAAKRVAFLGMTLCVISSLFISSAALLIKLAESIPSLEITFIRLTLQLVFSFPPMIFFKDKFIHPWSKSKFLLLRGVSGVTGMALSIYAVKHMPLADQRVIFYTSPVYTAILGRVFLKESVSKFDAVAILSTIGGVVLIARPTFLFGSLGEASKSEKVWFPTLLAVVSAICHACSIVLTRKISKEVGSRVVVFYVAVVGTIISLIASLISNFGFKFPDCRTHDALYVLGAGALGYGGQLLVTKALTLEKASIISLLRTTGIAFSFVLQLIVLHVVPDGLSIGGAILVLLCNVSIFIKKFLDKKNSHAKASNNT